MPEKLKTQSTSMHVLYGVLIVLVIILAAFAGISYVVQGEIDTMCAKALEKYPGDKVEALITYLNAESPGYRERHRVVWTLGELRDDRALPTLRSLLKNKQYDQYEVEKAIKKITGEIPNPYFWR
jgi:HEAT repeat protein